jgi:hypothetical protein
MALSPEQKAAEEQKPSEELIPSGQTIYAEAGFAGAGKLEAAKPLLAEGGTSREANKAALRRHLEGMKDATDFLDYLDQIEQQAQSESSRDDWMIGSNAPSSDPIIQSSTLPDDLFRTGEPGRPGYSDLVLEEAKFRIRTGQVVPARRGLAKFARSLWSWWEAVRIVLNAPPFKSALYIEDLVREIWNAALSGNPIE